MRWVNLCLKRLFDFFGSLCGLIILSPVFAVTMFLIKIFMPGPIFFTQERVGKNGEIFEILKFRTMKVDKEAEKNLDFSKDKERLTRLGCFLRRTKIDELPQLINVLRGDMSLVGPRPTVTRQVKEYTAYQFQRLNMRPGMTGLAQVNGNVSLPWEQRIEYDIEYVKEFSLILDLKILVKTIGVVLLGEGRFQAEKRTANRNSL